MVDLIFAMHVYVPPPGNFLKRPMGFSGSESVMSSLASSQSSVSKGSLLGPVGDWSAASGPSSAGRCPARSSSAGLLADDAHLFNKGRRLETMRPVLSRAVEVDATMWAEGCGCGNGCTGSHGGPAEHAHAVAKIGPLAPGPKAATRLWRKETNLFQFGDPGFGQNVGGWADDASSRIKDAQGSQRSGSACDWGTIAVTDEEAPVSDSMIMSRPHAAHSLAKIAANMS